MFKPWPLTQLLDVLDAQLLGADVEVSSVTTDSRKVDAGALFIALQGENYDGHAFLDTAEQAGAVAAVVDAWQEESDLPQLIVADTAIALGQLGHLNRQSFHGQLVAVTGSSGKTTVKEMIASIGRQALGGAAVLATRGNLNNELGVPMTLLELTDAHRLAVIELGASHLGEIAYTRALAEPRIVLINNAGMAHAGEFGGPEHVVQAKGEILDELPEESIAILNRDDAAFPIWSERSSAKRIVSFSHSSSAADFYARDVQSQADGGTQFILCTPHGETAVRLQLAGAHNVSNAIAAAAVADCLGYELDTIVKGLQAMQPVAGRGVRHVLGKDSLLIDDSYNANPASMRAAIDVLSQQAGRRVLVLGEMGELGDWAEVEHRSLGEYATGNVDALYAVGASMQHAVEAFAGESQLFATQEQLTQFLLANTAGTTSYLIKGSRSAAMERVAEALIDAYKGGF